MDRLISEQAVIDAVSEWLYDKTRKESIETVIKAIPSAEPYKCDFTCKYYSNGICLNEEKKCLSTEPRTGHWICGLSWKCSECGYEDDRALGTDFCPNCGARLVEPQESEDKE